NMDPIRRLEAAGGQNSGVILYVCFDIVPQRTQQLDESCTLFLFLRDGFLTAILRRRHRRLKGLNPDAEGIQAGCIWKKLRVRFDTVVARQRLNDKIGVGHSSVAEGNME